MRKFYKKGPMAKKNISIDDQDFIVRCILGNDEERERLAKACLLDVRKIVAFGYGNKPDMDDVAQKALIAIFRDLNLLKNPGTFRIWMHRITYRVIYRHSSYLRKLKALFIEDAGIPDEMSLHSYTPISTILHKEAFDRTSKHLEKIKTKKRMAIVLSLFMEHIDSEIATIMGCSTKTAKRRIQAGKRELLAAIQKDQDLKEILEEVTK